VAEIVVKDIGDGLTEEQKNALSILTSLSVKKFNKLKELMNLSAPGVLDPTTLFKFIELGQSKGLDLSNAGVIRFKDKHLPGGNVGALRGVIGKQTALIYFHELTAPSGLTFDTTYTRSELIGQLNEIQSHSYEPLIQEAAEDFGLQPSVIGGVGSRESFWGIILRPRGAAGVGDRGHGRGLMQIDDRFHQFAKTGLWQNPRENIQFGCELLADNRELLRRQTGLTGRNLLRATLASYNAGLGGVLRAINQGSNVDSVTTGADYSKDVLDRAGWFQEFAGWQ
jgi:hypothetical protein